MKILVTGGAGFLGGRVIRGLLASRDAGRAPVAFDEIVSLDLGPTPVDDPRVSSQVGDLTDPGLVAEVVGADTVAVVHLAAVLSGGSEVDFDLSLRVNVDGTRNLLDACRRGGTRPRFAFASSLAVFGGELPAPVPPSWGVQPASTYGAFKAIGELLVNEYSRKGFVDGRVCRLPTIAVRPGRPNSAASSFASGIIREPLNGERAVCPVPVGTRLWLSSPDVAVANLLHALAVDADLPGERRTLAIPGISVTVQEMLDALAEVGGPAARARVDLVEDPRIMAIVCSWPGDFEIARELSLGFTRDRSFTDLVRQYRDEFAPGG